MSQVFQSKYNATNTNDCIDKIKDIAISAGWTLHDTISSPYGYVLYSDGENGDEMTTYLHIFNNVNKIVFQAYTYWDNVTHSGPFYIGYNTYNKIDTDDDGSFDTYISANKSCIVALSFNTDKWNFVSIGLLDPFTNEAEGTLQSGVSAGSNVVITLNSGEADNFKVGNTYQIVDASGGGRESTTVTVVNTGSNQITVDSLSYNYSSNAVIGNFPFRWFVFASGQSHMYLLSFSSEGTTNEIDNSGTNFNWINKTMLDPDSRAGGSNYYGLIPMLLYDGNTYVAGFPNSDYLYLTCDFNLTTHEHTVSIVEHDNGTSTGSNSSTTLNDTTKSWTTDEWSNKILMITAGIGAGQIRIITSNTSTQITVPTWTTIPDATSEYCICDEGWLFFYFDDSSVTAGCIKAY